MTKNTNLSVRNTAESATIPAFEEVYAMEYVQESIHILIKENSCKYPMLASYEDDIKQEMLIHLANSLEKFDQNRASIQTYCRMILLTGLRKARKNYLSKSWNILYNAMQIEDVIYAENSANDTKMSLELSRSSQIFSVNPAYISEKKEAFALALAKLSEKDREISRAIMSGLPLREISKRKICNNYYLYEHAIPAIRKVLQENYF